MEECLTYFRAAVTRPASAPVWGDWWVANEQRVQKAFPRLEYLRLKARELAGAEDDLRRTGQRDEPIRLDPEFMELLRSIDWLANCGRPLPDCPPGAVVARSGAEEASATRLAGTKAMRQGPAVELGNCIAANAHEMHAHWNDRARAVNAWLDASGLPAIWTSSLASVAASDDLAGGIRSDVLFAWLHHAHRSVPGCPDNYARLFSWYRFGRVVCGWAGDWPNGSLVVF